MQTRVCQRRSEIWLMELKSESKINLFVLYAHKPVGHQEMIEQLDAQPSGNVVIKALENPRATIIVDEEEESLCMESIVLKQPRQQLKRCYCVWEETILVLFQNLVP